ncbi:MAG: hypothetical protein LC808_08900 [Actinobacteria bacterium]|nr:hypothetical protein [Actinomycetota bacterium]
MQAWMHRYGWAVFLILGLVNVGRVVWFAHTKYGSVDPVGIAESVVFFAVSGWFFFRRNRP